MSELTQAQLLERVYHHYPRGKCYDDPGYEETPEAHCFRQVWDRALAEMPQFDQLIRALGQEFPGFTVGNTTRPGDGCYRLSVSMRRLPLNAPGLLTTVVGCVSILAPTYIVYAAEQVFDENKKGTARRPSVDFNPSGLAAQCAQQVGEHIKKAYADYQPFPPSLMNVQVPDICIHNLLMGEVKLRDALFMDDLDNLP